MGYSVKRERIQRQMTHPGFVVRLELEELDMNITEAAQRLDVSRPTLSKLVNEKQRVSPEMALKLGGFFGNGARLWLNLQTQYDISLMEHDPVA